MASKLASLKSLLTGKPPKDSERVKDTKDNKKKASPAPKKAAAKAAPAPAPKAAKGKKAAVEAPAPVAAKAAKGAKGKKAAEVPAPAPVKGAKGKKAPGVNTASLPMPPGVVSVGKGKKGKAEFGKGVGGTVGAEVAAASARAAANRQAKMDAGVVCREVACESNATSSGYCRLHYIKNWKRIKKKELLLKEGKLNRYIEELVAKYPDKYIEAIREDLTNDNAFNKVVTDLELDEGMDDFDADGDSMDNLIDSIRKDLDDESDIY